MTVYQELREGEVIRSATFDQITHFTADNKYVVAHYAGGQILLKDTLVELQAAHPELLKVHRSTLVKVDSILSAGRARNSYSYCLKVKGFAGDLPLSRRMYPVVNKFIRGGKPRKGIVTAAETEALLAASLGREAALQERLTVAEQRAGELEQDKRRLDLWQSRPVYFGGFAPSGSWSFFNQTGRTCYGRNLREALDQLGVMDAELAALNPAEGEGS